MNHASLPTDPNDPQLPAAALAALTKVNFADQTVPETLEKMLTITRDVVPDATEVSCTLVESARPWTAAFTGDLAVQLDERQYETGFGPCLDAADSGQPIAVDVADPDNPYQEFARAAARREVTHTLSMPLPLDAGAVGALNLYSRSGRAFTTAEKKAVSLFAGHVAVVAANLTSYHRATELAAQLRAALESRAVIEQAKGIVMLQHRCSSERAFALLARQSQQRNVKLRVLAESLVRKVDQTSAAEDN